MITLYLILFAIIGLGALALALIALGYMKHSQQKTKSLPVDKGNDSITPKQAKLAPIIPPIDDPVLVELGFSALDEPEPEPEPIIATQAKLEEPIPIRPAAPIKREVIVFYILAPAKQPFIGYELLQAVLTAGLRYGEMNIFHRYDEQQTEYEKSPILFSLASAVEPGIFDMANIGSTSCLGLSIFLTPTRVENPLAVFELMLETAQQLADDLGGQLCDEQRHPLSAAAIEKCRTTLLERELF